MRPSLRLQPSSATQLSGSGWGMALCMELHRSLLFLPQNPWPRTPQILLSEDGHCLLVASLPPAAFLQALCQGTVPLPPSTVHTLPSSLCIRFQPLSLGKASSSSSSACLSMHPHPHMPLHVPECVTLSMSVCISVHTECGLLESKGLCRCMSL